jgi:N-acetylmuramoyl-L-alanine amidase
MCHRAHRFLHVLACAPVLAVVAIALAPSTHARVLAASATPTPASTVRPVVVVLDPGHGGSPNNADPTQAYDSGAISTLGQMEKDITLDVARRTAALLTSDDVTVVLTRNTDVFMDIPSRSQVAIDHHADVFTSIHMNGFTDPAASGSVVLYPNESDHQFASEMAASLDRALGPLRVSSRGTMLRDNWWIRIPCPVVTVEPVFLTNPAEAQLMARDDVRTVLAGAVKDGIEAQVPDIQARKPALEAYRAAHRGSLPATPVDMPSGVVVPASQAQPGDPHADPVRVPSRVAPPAPATNTPRSAGAGSATASGGTDARGIVERIGLAIILLALAWRFRTRLLHGAAVLSAALVGIVASLDGREAPAFVERFSHRRRHLARRRRVLERSRMAAGARPYRSYPWNATVTAATRPIATTTPRRTGSGSRRARPAPR